MPRLCRAGSIEIGPGRPLAIIAGPCVLESLDLGLTIGRALKDHCARHGLSYIFKASFDKANRTSIDSPRGPGLEQGLAWMKSIRDQLDVPITTDIHDPSQADPAARVVDILQIPAFLCRQTDLLVAAGRAASTHNKAVNVKKGQFTSPDEMAGPVHKLAQAGCANVMLTERGTFFGYNRLVNDFLGVADMMTLDHKPVGTNGAQAVGGPVPVCFDCTHSTQQPGKGDGGKVTGGRSDLAPLLARAATAAGVHALFMECHPDPKSALSDAATVIPLDKMGAVLRDAAAIRAALR